MTVQVTEEAPLRRFEHPSSVARTDHHPNVQAKPAQLLALFKDCFLSPSDVPTGSRVCIAGHSNGDGYCRDNRRREICGFGMMCCAASHCKSLPRTLFAVEWVAANAVWVSLPPVVRYAVSVATAARLKNRRWVNIHLEDVAFCGGFKCDGTIPSVTRARTNAAELHLQLSAVHIGCNIMPRDSTIPGLRNVARRREAMFRTCCELSRCGVEVWAVVCIGGQRTVYKSSDQDLFDALDFHTVGVRCPTIQYPGLPRSR